MPRLEQMPPEDMPEVVRRAALLHQQEQDDAQERRATVDAAAEVGLPPESLERAAQEVHAARVVQIQTRRRRRGGALATLGIALALTGGWAVTHRPPPAPAAYQLAAPAEGWHLEQDAGSQATLTTSREGTRIQVARFGAGQPFVNLDSKNVPPTLSGFRTVTFRVRGSGLPQIRLYLENGQERWRSPALPVSATWQTQTLPLTEFDRQTRRSASDGWRREGYRAPSAVERLSFKLGSFVNPPTARGAVEISGLEFK